MPADEPAASDEQSTAAPPPAADDDPWGFSEQPVPEKESNGKKKKKKSRKDARKIRVEDGEDSSAYPRSITPSPPDHGAQLRPASGPPQLRAQPDRSRSPLVDLIEDEATATEDVEPPSLLPSKPASKPDSSPVVLSNAASPRFASTRPVPSVSPPSRPVSQHDATSRDRNNSLTGFRPTFPVAQHTQTRRDSTKTSRPRFVEPPPPHMPQAHFFGLPDLGLKFNQKQGAGALAGSEGYCCRIDSLADAGDEESAKKSKEALLVGSEGGLEVFRILSNKLEVVGRLEGLRGSTIDAKILPHTDRFDNLQPLRPLIAVIVHGPVTEDRADSGPEGEERESFEIDTPTHFQISVEVFSLKSSLYVATLYKGPKVAVEHPSVGQVSSLPEPFGDLGLDAQGRYITLSSGKSGELFVFTQQPALSGLENTRFRCVGKFWTVVRKTISAASRPPAVGDNGASMAHGREEPCKPLYSLNRRWLAIVPPSNSPDISIQGTPLMCEVNPNPPGVTTHAAPPPPTITCEVVGTDIEGVWSRLGRQAAQGLMKYSQRGFEMGLQGWKELTQPSPPSTRAGHDRSSSKEDLFPPTKAPLDDPGRLAREPALVSIIDLDSLIYWEDFKPKHLTPPLATFALTEGCSFLSLSSVGTRLLTASRKGESSTIWDLTQIAHGVAGRPYLANDNAGGSQCIKQLQRIIRNSPSTVLDCAWSRDDDAIAVLTAHGTTHLHEVPLGARSRKRRRAGAGSTPAAEKADATLGLQSGVSPPSSDAGFLGSIKSSWQSVSTQVNSIRSTSAAATFGLPTTFAGFREVTAAAGHAGGRAVARGLSQGYIAAKGGASDYWHADDNKIRHTRALQDPYSAKSMRWIRRNNTTSVAIACGGSVHIHPVQRATRRKGDAIVTGLKHERYAQKSFPLPPIATRNDAGGPKALGDPCIGQGPHGFWSLRNISPGTNVGNTVGWQTINAHASDVETNPPYCPFHIDGSINICTFQECDDNGRNGVSATFNVFQSKGHDVGDEAPWTFGESLPPSTRVNEFMPVDEVDQIHDENDEDGDDEFASQMESKLTIQPANRGGQQIRINTRRKQGRGRSESGAADGDFELMEDDDDMV